MLEDDGVLAGYAVAADDYKCYSARLKSEWLPALRERYKRPVASGDSDDKEALLTATQVRLQTSVFQFPV